jgi:hypothetical protein
MRLRFTVRQLMVGVAAVGTLVGPFCWGIGVWLRTEEYLRLANHHAALATRLSGEQARYHDRMRRKYERAAIHPLEPLPPNPAPPQP